MRCCIWHWDRTGRIDRQEFLATKLEESGNMIDYWADTNFDSNVLYFTDRSYAYQKINQFCNGDKRKMRGIHISE